MGRYKGSLITSNYATTKRFPIDSRMLVTSVSDLINPSIWITHGTQNTDSLFNGLITAVNSGADAGIYYLVSKDAITQNNYDAYIAAVNSGSDTAEFFTMWKKLGTLEEINLLSKRVLALENNGQSSTGITQEELTAQIDALRQEILDSGYVTESRLQAVKAELEAAIDKKADKEALESLSNRVSDIENIDVTIINGGTASVV